MSSLLPLNSEGIKNTTFPHESASPGSLAGRAATRVDRCFPKLNSTLSKVILASGVIAGAGIVYAATNLYGATPLLEGNALNVSHPAVVEVNCSTANSILAVNAVNVTKGTISNSSGLKVNDSIANTSLAVNPLRMIEVSLTFQEKMIEYFLDSSDERERSVKKRLLKELESHLKEQEVLEHSIKERFDKQVNVSNFKEMINFYRERPLGLTLDFAYAVGCSLLSPSRGKLEALFKAVWVIESGFGILISYGMSSQYLQQTTGMSNETLACLMRLDIGYVVLWKQTFEQVKLLGLMPHNTLKKVSQALAISYGALSYYLWVRVHGDFT